MGEDVNFSLANQPLGQVLEILPVSNITTVEDGGFQFLVLFEREPMPNLDYSKVVSAQVAFLTII